jgi:hypothetical protein
MAISNYKRSYVSAEIRNLEDRLRPVIEDGVQSNEATVELAHIDQRVARLCYDCHTEQWPDDLREALQSLYDQMGYADDYEIPRPE